MVFGRVLLLVTERIEASALVYLALLIREAAWFEHAVERAIARPLAEGEVVSNLGDLGFGQGPWSGQTDRLRGGLARMEWGGSQGVYGE